MSADNLQKSFTSSRASTVVRAFVLLLGVALIGLLFSGDVRLTGGPGFGITELLLLCIGVANLLAGLLGGTFMFTWLICQVSVGVTLVLAELALQATVSHRYLSPYQLDDRYLYDLVPGARREYRHLPVNGGSQIYNVNSLGFRGEEFAVERGNNPRVVIYGDSFIHAEYTPLEHTLASQLSVRLSEQLGKPVEVINAGVAGYGTDQVLRRVEDELEWLQPDLVIVAIFTGNDFGDLLRNKLYRLGPDGRLIENDYTLSDEIQLNAELELADPLLRKIGREAKERIRFRLQGSPDSRSAPDRLTEERLEQHVREYREYIVDGDNTVRDLRTDPYSADIALLPDSPSARYKLELMDAIVDKLRRKAEAQGVPLMLLAIPHPMDVMGGAHASGAVDFAKYPNYLPSRLTDSVQAIAERQGIDYVNLFQDFRNVDNPAELYLKGGDDHWNNAGQAYAADILAAQVARHRYLQREPASVGGAAASR